jgi:hypothetical protein
MFTQRLHLSAQDGRKISSTRLHQLGSIAETADGRVYRYARAGASNLVSGNLQVNADLIANHTNRGAGAAAAIGAREVSIAVGATAVTLDQYRDGFLTVNDATGEGITYSVNGNSASAGSTSVVVSLNEPVTVALVATTSELTLKQNPWGDTVISATDQADLAVGVPNVAVTATYYYWAQTRGECAVWADEAVTKGLALTIGTGTAGQVEALDGVGEPQIGIASEALVDTENRSAFLTMD